MRRTTWPAPTSVHDLQPGRRSLRLKGVKSGAAEIRTPIRGSGSVAPFHTPIRGSRDAWVFCSPLSGIWDLWPLALTPIRGFWRPLSGSFFSPLSLGPWCQAPWPLQVSPMRGFCDPFPGLVSSHPYPGFCSAMMKSYGNLTS